MRIAIEAVSDVGLVRELNEDSFRVLPEHHAVVVCDGMGGHAAGEVASATAADTISDWIREADEAAAGSAVPPLAGDWPPEALRLAAAVRLANRRLYNDAARSHKLRGMGTTVAAAIFRPGAVITAHVGDSRVYRITEDHIERLTVDHSWVAELLESGQVRPEDVERFADKNVITRALGTRAGVQVDLGIHGTRAGEIYLVCSDGLCGYVSDAEIHRRVREQAADLKQAALALVNAANEAGGLDNSTVALVRVDEGGGPTAASLESVTIAEESEADLAHMDEILLRRYHEGGAAEDHTEGDVPPIESKAAKASGRGNRWQWLVLLALLAALVAVLIWGRPPEKTPDAVSKSAPAPSPPAAGPETTAPSHSDNLALLFVAPGMASRSATLYLDGVGQGTLAELESGLLVDPGVHTLTVLDSLGDTLMKERMVFQARDTLDVVVR